MSASQDDKKFQPTYHSSMSLVSLPNQSHSHVLFSLPVDSQFSLDPPQRVGIALAFFLAEWAVFVDEQPKCKYEPLDDVDKSISAVPA